MKRLILLLFAGICLFPLQVYTQFDEAGLFLGFSHYAGDLTERTLEPLGFHGAGGFYLRQKLNSHIGIKYHLYKGKISGDDALSSAESGLWRRNLSFESEIYELAALIEYELFKITDGHLKTAPYVYTGVAGFYFSPQTQANGKTYNLNTYKTEGEAYSLYQFAIPFGVGMKLLINGSGCLGIEAGFRKTFTDYLDDVSGYYPADLFAGDGQQFNTRNMLSYRSAEVNPDAPDAPQPGSQRGNPDKDDWYMFFGLSVGIAIR